MDKTKLSLTNIMVTSWSNWKTEYQRIISIQSGVLMTDIHTIIKDIENKNYVKYKSLLGANGQVIGEDDVIIEIDKSEYLQYVQGVDSFYVNRIKIILKTKQKRIYTILMEELL